MPTVRCVSINTDIFLTKVHTLFNFPLLLFNVLFFCPRTSSGIHITVYFFIVFGLWGTCARPASGRLLHKCIHAMVVCSLHLSPYHPSPISCISPHTISPQLSTPCCPSPIPPNRPQFVVLPSLCPCVLMLLKENL